MTAGANLTASAQDGEAARVLLPLREASAHWRRQEQSRPRCTTGLAALDELLGGGWPYGKVSELIGPISSGRTGAAMATVAAAAGRGEVAAWIDAGDAFDPPSALAAGVDLARLLWVRPRGLEQAVRAAELVLEAGGFTVVVLDVDEACQALREPDARGPGQRRKAPLRIRLARAVERARAVGLVMGARPWVGTCAAVTLVLGRGVASWGGGEGCGVRWLEGLILQVRVERGGVGEVGRTTAPVLAWGRGAATR